MTEVDRRNGADHLSFFDELVIVEEPPPSRSRRRHADPSGSAKTLLPNPWSPETGAIPLELRRRQFVVREKSSGPQFSRGRVPFAQPEPDTFVRLLRPVDRTLVRILTGVWIGLLIAFWIWLLEPQHRVSWAGLVLNGALLVYLSIVPLYFLIAANRMWGVNPELPIPDLRVAFAVTKAPSEPWPVARKTLQAMLNQDFPYSYHVWLCDEDPDPETLDWCARHGVGVSTRRGVDDYHRTSWPRRTKCKEGNLAFFYDHWGYQDYDVVSQLDCDHVPARNYLSEIVRPFEDPSIGYVAAPSVCDANASESWAASGRLHAEASFHGSLQIGQNGIAPVCIGSHYAVRTRALQEIGGIGPDLAEDFSTTFLLTSAGWQGAFAHQAEAHGDGPITMAAMVTQEFQWSRSLVTLLLGVAPGHLPRMPWRLRFRFLFTLLYYPVLSMMTVIGVFLPPIAAVTGTAWLNVNYIEFIVRWGSMTLCLFAINMLLRHRNLLRPTKPPIISWQNWLYVFVRWPYILRGTIAAVRQSISPRQVRFAVTPKGVDGFEPLKVSVILPFLAISLMTSCSAVYGERHTLAFGYVFLCIAACLSYTLVCLLTSLLHAHEAARQLDRGFVTAVRKTVAVPLSLSVAAIFPLAIAIGLYPSYVAGVFHW